MITYTLAFLLFGSLLVNLCQFIAWLRAQADLDEAGRRLEAHEGFR